MSWTRFSGLAASLAAAVIACGAAQAQIGRSDAPIEINADQGEFLQNEGRVVYTGNVQAIQGESRITTNKLTAFCRQGPASSGEAPACEAIDRLVAEGNRRRPRSGASFLADADLLRRLLPLDRPEFRITAVAAVQVRAVGCQPHGFFVRRGQDHEQAADHVLRFDERPVADQRLAGGCAGAQAFAAFVAQLVSGRQPALRGQAL